MNALAPTGIARLKQIIGCKKAGIAPLVPVSASTWWAGCKTGRFPAPVRLGPRSVGWRMSDIAALIQNGANLNTAQANA